MKPNKHHNSDGWFYLVIPLAIAIILFALMYAVAGCVADEAAIVRQVQAAIKTEVKPIVAGIASTHEESNKAAVRAKRIERSVNIGSQNFDRWALYLLITMPFITYIVPKIGWHLTSKAASKAKKMIRPRAV